MEKQSVFGGTFFMAIGIALMMRFFISLPEITAEYYGLAYYLSLIIYSLIIAFGAYIIWGNKK